MKPFLPILWTSLCLSISPAFADHHAQPPAMPLWPDGAPGAKGEAPHDVPSIQAYLPKEVSGPVAAVVVCPGGGYGGLANHEGHDYALWLNEQGLAAFVLKYRLGSKGYRHPIMVNLRNTREVSVFITRLAPR